ncbi:MAG TPA: hypothetical protein VJO35_03300 [Terriglobales bacterium]|nr:hypothetical protein [Terriglobales bacterium]
MRVRASQLFLVCVLFLLAPPQNCLAQGPTKRLILTDGSYQIVTKWEVQGDRVHYFSAERNEWEDVPNSMVDWNATREYEQDRATGKMSPEAQRLEKELQQERQEDEAKSPHVAPGLRLPPEGGVYALDTYLGEPQLLPLDQTGGDINRHTGHNVLRQVMNPVSGAKHTVELSGPRSKLQVHASLPTIYINIDASNEDTDDANAEAPANSKAPTAELPWDRFRIVRVQVKGDKRIVGTIKVEMHGKSSPEEDAIPASAEQLQEGWIKLTPTAALQPGEYAVTEMLGKEGMNSYVWDFGVHADAPANLSVIRPERADTKESSHQSAPAVGK